MGNSTASRYNNYYDEHIFRNGQPRKTFGWDGNISSGIVVKSNGDVLDFDNLMVLS